MSIRPDANADAPPRTPSPILVLKFGSSVLQTDRNIERAVAECYRHARDGRKVIAVVSAFGETTNELIRRAELAAGGHFRRAAVPQAADWSFATLQATGEIVSASLLGIALERSGIPSGVVDANQISLIGRPTGAEHGRLSADPVSVDADAFRRLFEWASVVVVPGYVLLDEHRLPLLLGRGGSDLTAIFLGYALGAEVRLIKDVAGIYESDPASPVGGPRPRLFARIGYEEALRVGGRAIQPRAVKFAKEHGVPFEVLPLNTGRGTRVEPGASVFATERFGRHGPLRVAMLGVGTVGLGVVRLLETEPARFELIGACVRNPAKHAEDRLPDGVLTSSVDVLLAREFDVLIEVAGGRAHARHAILTALGQGRAVVTANKAALAEDWLALREAATIGRLRYSAAVGGVTPCVETVRRVGAFRSLRAVLNGTTNFVLARLADGLGYDEAVAEAQALGFAEADPTMDVDGTDAAQKLAILIREALDPDFDLASVERRGIDGLDAAEVRGAAARGRAYRLVAEAAVEGSGRIRASVRPVELPATDPLAEVRDEWNRLVVVDAHGVEHVATGRGAGRWPTAQAVYADLLDLERLLLGRVVEEPEPARGLAEPVVA